MNNNFSQSEAEEPIDWSKYERKQPAEQAPQAQEEMQDEPMQSVQQEPIDWLKYERKDISEKPALAKEAGRHITRTASRIGETIVGLPGDLLQFGKWVADKVPESIKFADKDPNFIQKLGQRFLENVPTSSEIKNKVSEITGGFTDPQNAYEEFGDSIVELASALSFGKDPTKIGNLMKVLGKSVVAKGARKGSELLGAGEKGQFATEMGTLLLTGLFDKDLAGKAVSDKYSKARNLIPKNDMIETTNLVSNLESLESDLAKGISTASKNEVKGVIGELKAKASGGLYPVDDLVETYHNVNERMSPKLFSEMSKLEKKQLKYRYDKFKSAVSKEIDKYGKKNPKFLDEWRAANQSFSVLQDSQKITSFLEKNIGKLPPHLVTGVSVELLLGHPAAAAATVGTFGMLKTGELLYRVAKDPTLRRHYVSTVNAAAAENFPAMVSSMNKLDKGLKKSFLTGGDLKSKELSKED